VAPFIDYVSLLLLNMLCGYFLLAWYVASGLDDADQGRWAPAFGMVGLVAAVFGGVMAATWPLPGAYGYMFGEMSVVFGVVFLGAAVAFARGSDLRPVALYALFAGLAAVVVGIRIMVLRLTKEPVLAGVGFILSGLGGVGALPTLVWFRRARTVRYVAAAVLVLAGLIWAATVYPEYWLHPAIFGKWVPMILRNAPPSAP
jgi:putative membrane protein